MVLSLLLHTVLPSFQKITCYQSTRMKKILEQEQMNSLFLNLILTFFDRMLLVLYNSKIAKVFLLCINMPLPIKLRGIK